MYGKEEFIRNLKGQRYYSTLLEWLENFSDPKALAEIHKRHDDMPDNMPECYVVECARWYVQVKMCDVQDFRFSKNGMKAEEEVYYYPPYHPGAFLAVLYAHFDSDVYRWETDNEKFYKLETFMQKNGYRSFYKAIRTIIDQNEMPPKPKHIVGRSFSIAGRRVHETEEPKVEIATAVAAKADTVLPTDVALSAFFSQELQSNKAKRLAFLKVMREKIKPKVMETKGSRDLKWKWPHVEDALFNSKHIVSKDNNAEFGRGMELVTGENAKNVEQAFKRFSLRPTHDNIVLAIQGLVDGAIANAKEPDDEVEVCVKPRSKENKISELPFPVTGLAKINKTMAVIVDHILSLEPYFCTGCTKEVLIDGFEDFATKFASMLNHFNPKRERHVMCHIIYRLWMVSFIRRDVPVLEEAIQLSKSIGDGISAKKLCDKLMGCLHDSLPEDEILFYNLFEHNFRVFMQSKGLDTDRKHNDEDVTGGAHEEYIAVIEEREKTIHHAMIELTLRTKEFFMPPVNEALIYEFYMAMHRELSNVVSLVRLTDSQHLERGVAKIIGELLKLNIYKPDTSRSALAKRLSKDSSVSLLVRNLHDGTKDEILNSWIRMFWSDMHNILP